MGCKVQKLQNKQLFNYELIYQFDFQCRIKAFAVNKAKNLMVFGTDSEIIISLIQKGCIKLLNKIQQGPINVLNFFLKKAYYLSGLDDSQIFIWNSNIISNMKFIFKLQGHTSGINCVVLNSESEEMIISGSQDCTIKFWTFSPQGYQKSYCKQTINEHTQAVNSLAINSDGNTLISCSNDNTLLIIEVSIEKKWILKQRIQMPQYGYRLSFITNDSFSFQPNSYRNGRYLHIFQFNSSNQQFHKILEIPVRGRNQYCIQGFPSTYIQSKNLLQVKNGYYINIFRILPSKTLAYQHILEQTIEFGTRYVFGTQSKDGELLITWDAESNQIQIRKLITKDTIYNQIQPSGI